MGGEVEGGRGKVTFNPYLTLKTQISTIICAHHMCSSEGFLKSSKFVCCRSIQEPSPNTLGRDDIKPPIFGTSLNAHGILLVFIDGILEQSRFCEHNYVHNNDYLLKKC